MAASVVLKFFLGGFGACIRKVQKGMFVKASKVWGLGFSTLTVAQGFTTTGPTTSAIEAIRISTSLTHTKHQPMLVDLIPHRTYQGLSYKFELLMHHRHATFLFPRAHASKGVWGLTTCSWGQLVEARGYDDYIISVKPGSGAYIARTWLPELYGSNCEVNLTTLLAFCIILLTCGDKDEDDDDDYGDNDAMLMLVVVSISK